MNNLIKTNKLNQERMRSQRGKACVAVLAALLFSFFLILSKVVVGPETKQAYVEWAESANKDIVELESGTSKYSIEEQQKMLLDIRNINMKMALGTKPSEGCFAFHVNNGVCASIYEKLNAALVNSIARAGGKQFSQNHPQATTDQAALIKKVLDERKARESAPIPLSEADLESMSTEELEALYTRSLKSSQETK